MTGRGVVSGALALIALQAVTSSDQAAGRVGGMLAAVGKLVRHVVDPAVPAIPDLSGSGLYDPDGDGPLSPLKRPLDPDLGIGPNGQPRQYDPGTEHHA